MTAVSSPSIPEFPATSTETKIITLKFLSNNPEEGISLPESNEKEFVVFTIPYFKENKFSLIAWSCHPCGIQLTDHAIDELLDFSEEIENPWCAKIKPTSAGFKAPVKLLSKFRTKLTKVFEDSGSWKSLDGSGFNGEVIREAAVA
jgi:hypothetical protein